MKFIKNLLTKFIGKKLNAETGKMEGTSKAKLVAVVAVLVVAVEKLSPAFGYPIVIPQELFRILEAAGLWSIRDALK